MLSSEVPADSVDAANAWISKLIEDSGGHIKVIADTTDAAVCHSRQHSLALDCKDRGYVSGSYV